MADTTTTPRFSQWQQAAAAIAAALAMNAIVFSLGWDSADQPLPSAEWAPPGWVIGTVWLFLFGLMGAARWRTQRDAFPSGTRLVEAVLAACLVFPVYTQGLESALIGLIGTLATLALTGLTVLRLRTGSPKAARLLGPLVLWLIFAATLTARALQLRA